MRLILVARLNKKAISAFYKRAIFVRPTDHFKVKDSIVLSG